MWWRNLTDGVNRPRSEKQPGLTSPRSDTLHGPAPPPWKHRHTSASLREAKTIRPGSMLEIRSEIWQQIARVSGRGTMTRRVYVWCPLCYVGARRMCAGELPARHAKRRTNLAVDRSQFQRRASRRPPRWLTAKWDDAGRPHFFA